MEIARHWSGKALAPELILLRGELLLAVSEENAAEAEARFRQTLAIGEEIQALMLQLRAAANPCRLRRDPPSRALLSGNYQQFSEGFNCADPVAARALLDEASEQITG